MSPLYEFECPKCSEKKEEMAKYEEVVVCPTCNVPMERSLSTFGGYHIKGNNSASVRPKRAGSFKKGN